MDNFEVKSFEIKNTHYGQRRAYGDSFYEYIVKADDKIDRNFIIALIKAGKLYEHSNILLKQPSNEECKKDFGMNFATYLKELKKISDNEWFVAIVSPSTH